MELSVWLLYVSIISVLILSPGPSALLCMSSGITLGNKKTIPTILGGAIAALVLMSISAIGLGAILVASETLFFIIKLIGAAYLIYLGWLAWKEGSINTNNKNLSHYTPSEHPPSLLFKKGFMVGISNPKDLLFFIALFPNFIHAGAPQIEQYILLASTWFVIDCMSMFIYAGLGSKISPWLSTTNSMRLVNRITGGIFIILGSALAVYSGNKEN